MRALLSVVMVAVGSVGWAAESKTVSLKGDKVRLAAAILAVTEQTGVAVAVADDVGDPELDLALDAVPFWKALDTLAEKSQARLYLYGRDGKVTLVKAARGPRAPLSHDGAFRVALRRLTAVQDFEAGGRILTASLEVAWEPHLLPLYLDTRPGRLVVKDSRGRQLPTTEAGAQLAATEGRSAMLVEVTLPEAERGETKLSLIEGNLRLLAPSKMVTFSLGKLKDLAAAELPLVMRKGDTTCSLTAVKLGRTVWTVKLELTLPEGGPSFESFQSWVAHNELYLLDTGTRTPLPASGHELIDSSSRKARLTYYFEDTPGRKRGDPAELMLYYRAPASIREIPVPFRFVDVPLP